MIGRMNRTLYAYFNNFDAVDNAVSMGISSNNHVRPMIGFGGTDIDEMSIDYIKGISTWIASYSWTNA